MNESVKALLLLAAMVGGVYYLTKEQSEDEGEEGDSVKILPNPRKRKNYLKGGKGDNLSVKDVSKRELKRGIEVELEHTNSRRIAKEIALDHLAEDAKYYTKLKKIHKNPSNRKLWERASKRAEKKSVLLKNIKDSKLFKKLKSNPKRSKKKTRISGKK